MVRQLTSLIMQRRWGDKVMWSVPWVAMKLGREVFEQLNQIHLNHEFIAIDPQHPTGTATVELDSQGGPAFTIYENVAWDHITFSSGLKDLAARTNAVCSSSLAQRSEVSSETIHSFLESVSPDCLCVFDINLRQSFSSKAIVLESLKFADALKLNDDDELLLVSELFFHNRIRIGSHVKTLEWVSTKTRCTNER